MIEKALRSQQFAEVKSESNDAGLALQYFSATADQVLLERMKSNSRCCGREVGAVADKE
ncbi:MAG TPA: hypothetical protein VGI42_02105 [Chthoniobacterales bacterium]|jgi:hypothetical protein